VKKIESLVKTAGMKFEFENSKIRFHKNKLSCLSCRLMKLTSRS